ncbi:NAD(P)-dependent oxidoreductase [Bacillus altitudinis]
MEEKKVDAEDVKDAFLIVAATDDPSVNEWMTQSALPHQLVNCVSQSELGNVIVPKVVRAGKVTISISTSGASQPALNSWLRPLRPCLNKRM